MKNISPLTELDISSALQELQGWNYDGSSHISARFKFKNYAESCAFVMRISLLAEAQNHHPDVRFGWGYAEIALTTHDANGVSERDISLATAINKIYNQ
jgi:4a-hydroxytetrahydrobiopterin dehydratase